MSDDHEETLIASAVIAGIFTAPAAFAFKEYPAGEPVVMNEMELAAVYLQPIDMEPRGMGLPAAKADIHLEADIHAVEGSKNGLWRRRVDPVSDHQLHPDQQRYR